VNRPSYARVHAAPAKIAAHCLLDLRIRGNRMSLQQRGSAHDLTWLAIPALRNLLENPGTLNRM
jgi:hypothetical protein